MSWHFSWVGLHFFPLMPRPFTDSKMFCAGLNFLSQSQILTAFSAKEVCNGGVAYSLLKLGSLEKTVIASLFLSGLHSGTIDVICYFGERQVMPFLTKKHQKVLRCKIGFLIICSLFCSNHFLIRFQTKVLL